MFSRTSKPKPYQTPNIPEKQNSSNLKSLPGNSIGSDLQQIILGLQKTIGNQATMDYISQLQQQTSNAPFQSGSLTKKDLSFRQELEGYESNEIKSIKERPIAELAMGQALISNMGQIILHSQNFSSCSPVIMFNETSGKGGLMHFPAGALEQQGENLKTMYAEVQPNVAYLRMNEFDNEGSEESKEIKIEKYEDDNEKKEDSNDEELEEENLEDEEMEEEDLETIKEKNKKNKDFQVLVNYLRKTLGYKGEIMKITSNTTSYAVTLGQNKNLIFEKHFTGNGESLPVLRDRNKEERDTVQKNWKNKQYPKAIKLGVDQWTGVGTF